MRVVDLLVVIRITDLRAARGPKSIIIEDSVEYACCWPLGCYYIYWYFLGFILKQFKDVAFFS